MLRFLGYPWFGLVRDAAAVFVATAIVFTVADGYELWEVLTLALIAASLQSAWFAAANVYDTSHPRVARPPFNLLVRGLTWVLLTYLATHFLTNGEPERRTIVFAWGATVAGISLIYAVRALALVVLQRHGDFQERLLIVGGNLQAETVARQIAAQRSQALQVVGVLDEFSARSSRIGPLPVLGDPLELEAVVDRHGITSVVVLATAVSWEAQEHVMQVAAQRPGLRVFMVAGVHDLLSAEVVAARDGMPSLVRLRPAQLGRVETVMKRAMDIGAAIVLLPALGVTCLLARLDGGGPTTRTVEVLGRDGRVVRMRLLSSGPPGSRRARLAAGRAGKLPALFGVLRGDLSIVGPRPLPATAATRDGSQRRLLLVAPGLTGPWDSVQAEAHSSLLDDLSYIRTYSLWTDVRLMLTSVRRTVMSESAVPAMREVSSPTVSGGQTQG